jgi:hypothetical protein
MRSLILAVSSALLLATSVAPAFAGPSEAAFLNRLAGSWNGSGRVTGEESGPVSCKLVFKANGPRLNYTGRCSMQDMGAQSFSGSIRYDDASRRYLVSSSNGTIVGVRRGNALVFTTKTQSVAGATYSTMNISPSSISIDFTITGRSTGGKTRSHISFSR